LMARFRRSAGCYVNGRFAHCLENNTELYYLSTLVREFVKFSRGVKLCGAQIERGAAANFS
jgi:hypothetical protein